MNFKCHTLNVQQIINIQSASFKAKDYGKSSSLV